MHAIARTLALLTALVSGERSSPQIVDAMPAFVALFQQDASSTARAQAFRASVLTPFAVAYNADQRSMSDTALSRYLNATEPYITAMTKIDRQMRADLPIDVSRFRAAFPDFDLTYRIYLVPSLDTFDGTVRDAGDEPGVLFGVDELAKLGNTSRRKLDVVATHEFVHLYQGERNAAFQSLLNADVPPVWATLWSEGLATFVSRSLVPGSTMADALGDRLAVVSSTQKRAAACEIAAHLSDATPTSAERFFGGGARTATGGLPVRSGYLIGYTLVSQMAVHHSLRDLLMMSGEPLKAAVTKGVRILCASQK